MSHQLQVFADNRFVLVTVAGSATIDFKSRSVSFDETARPLTPAARTSKEQGDCPGCSKKGLQRLVTGAIGWAKTAIGADQAALPAQERREETCIQCPSGCYRFGVCDETRGGCGCLLAIKVQIASERCPHGHWTEETADARH